MTQVHDLVPAWFYVTADKSRLDLAVVMRLLGESYWASSRSLDTVERSIEHSLCIGAFLIADDAQIGFARIVTDFADFAWLCDVVVAEAYRGKGVGKALVRSVLAREELQGMRRWILATRDAHALYAKFGFAALTVPEIWMERPGRSVAHNQPCAAYPPSTTIGAPVTKSDA